MIQGTASNAGKSLLAAGLCRVFANDGYRVAPFKSQNMALNSFITRDGLEMGRAQVLQAQAAKTQPDVRMNPILLKPTNDVGSQVIVNGEVLGNMSARDYFAMKKRLVPVIKDAYDSLAAENDIIVIEGAGSPAEINLKADDIVNMGLARLVGAPVLLAGDIDRGGVFASLYGTVALLEEDEKKLIKAFIINKFRGDETLLTPGLDMLSDMTRIPFAGVLPFIKNLALEDEDSLSAKLEFSERDAAKPIDIAVIRLPKISNFTDFDALSQNPAASVRYVGDAKGLSGADIIILPGSKNTIEDLRWLRESGLEAAIKKEAVTGTPVVGICGGFQMLGQRISDPFGVEGGGDMRGMQLLDIETVFAGEKTRTQIKGRVNALTGFFAPLSGCELEGYEIHMGESRPLSAEPFFAKLSNQREDGFVSENIFGSYLHGLFDAALGERLIELLLRRKGITKFEKPLTASEIREKSFDLLESAVRESLDIDMIYKIIEDGV